MWSKEAPKEPRRPVGWWSHARRFATASFALLALASLAPGLARADRPGTGERVTERRTMVERQIRARGILNPRVLEAMRTVPRHLFVPSEERGKAYEDHPLSIGNGQTISQPYIVAAMTELLDPKPEHRVLEIGSGSGYQAAVLSVLAREVFTIEIIPELSRLAAENLKANGYPNVVVVTGDGYRGLPEKAPFDGIIVTAAPEKVPQPLLDQLKIGGRLVIPVGDANQKLQVFERTKDGVSVRTVFDVRFVPMTGEAQKKQ